MPRATPSFATPPSRDDLIDVPVRTDAGGVARLVRAEGGIVAEEWTPASATWERAELVAALNRPAADAELLDGMGVAESDRMAA